MFDFLFAYLFGTRPIERRTRNAVIFAGVSFVCYVVFTLAFFITVTWLLGAPMITILTEPMMTVIAHILGFLLATYFIYRALCDIYGSQGITAILSGFDATYLMLQNYPGVLPLSFVYIVLTAYGLFNVYRGIALRLEKPHEKTFKIITLTALALFGGVLAFQWLLKYLT